MLFYNGKIDLHIHSNASDGTWTPEKIVSVAKEKGVELISLTDHDEISNVETCKKICMQNNLKFLSGVEISSIFNGEEIHILGFGIDIHNHEFNEFIKENRIKLEHKDTEAIRILIERGYKLNLEEYEKYTFDTQRGGWKALNYLIDNEICKDVNDFFEKLSKNEKILESPTFPSPEEVVKIVKKAGGVPVLAHPYYSKCDEVVEKRLSQFVELGIEGVECFHPNHSRIISEECANWCRKSNLIITCGSDSHGSFIKTRCIGKPEVDSCLLNIEGLKKYLN